MSKNRFAGRGRSFRHEHGAGIWADGELAPRRRGTGAEQRRRERARRAVPALVPRGDQAPAGDALPPPDGRRRAGQLRRARPAGAHRRVAARRRQRADGPVDPDAGKPHGRRPRQEPGVPQPSLRPRRTGVAERGRCGSAGASPRSITSAGCTSGAPSPGPRGWPPSPAWRSSRHAVRYPGSVTRLTLATLPRARRPAAGR